MTQGKQDNRRRLLDMAAGGTGHAGTWVELITYDATATTPERKGAIVHMPAGDGKSLDLVTDMEHIANLLYLISGRLETDSPEERAAYIAQLLEETEMTDYGRRITAEMQALHKY